MIKPGHTSLNIEDISEDLRVVHRHVTKVAPSTTDPITGAETFMRKDGDINKPVLQNYWNKIIKADDVDLVAGIEAGRTAVAVSKDNRTTIDNAMKLNGHPAEDFTTAE